MEGLSWWYLGTSAVPLDQIHDGREDHYHCLPLLPLPSCSSSEEVSWVAHRGPGKARTASLGPLVLQPRERNDFGKEAHSLLEGGMGSLQTNLEDLSEGGFQYVGHLPFEMISVSLLSK